MDKKTGWRAIIYDAPWAFFKKGQDGVIVSEDGKACETVDDDKSKIIVIADRNDDFNPRQNGHILFRQKGSDLYDIVCLYQKPSEHKYKLCADNVELSACDGSWQAFKSSLKVYWVKDDTERIQLSEDEYGIISPTAQDNFNVADGTSYTITVTAKTSSTSKVYTNDSDDCKASCIIKSSDDGYETYRYTEFNIDNVVLCKSEGQKICTLTIKDNNFIKDCNGGILTFEPKIDDVTDTTYIIDYSNASADNFYNVKQCDGWAYDNDYIKEGELDVEILSDGTEIIRKDGKKITFSIANNNITSIKIRFKEIVEGEATKDIEVALSDIGNCG